MGAATSTSPASADGGTLTGPAPPASLPLRRGFAPGEVFPSVEGASLAAASAVPASGEAPETASLSASSASVVGATTNGGAPRRARPPPRTAPRRRAVLPRAPSGVPASSSPGGSLAGARAQVGSPGRSSPAPPSSARPGASSRLRAPASPGSNCDIETFPSERARSRACRAHVATSGAAPHRVTPPAGTHASRVRAAARYQLSKLAGSPPERGPRRPRARASQARAPGTGSQSGSTTRSSRYRV